MMQVILPEFVAYPPASPFSRCQPSMQGLLCQQGSPGAVRVVAHAVRLAPRASARSARPRVAEEAAVIDLADYVLEPLHQDGACLLYRGQAQTHTDTRLPSLLVVAPVGDHPFQCYTWRVNSRPAGRMF